MLVKEGGRLSTPKSVEGERSVSASKLPSQKLKLRGWLALAVFFLTVTAGYGLMFLVLDNMFKG